jgi:hypothetical protein
MWWASHFTWFGYFRYTSSVHHGASYQILSSPWVKVSTFYALRASGGTGDGVQVHFHCKKDPELSKDWLQYTTGQELHVNLTWRKWRKWELEWTRLRGMCGALMISS